MSHPSPSSNSPTDPTRRWALVPFACTQKPDGWGSVWIHPVGELDLATCPLFQREVEEAQDDANVVSIDLQELLFIDCAGLNVIAHAAARSAVMKAKLTLVGPTGQVKRLFGLTGLPETVEVVEFGSLQPRSSSEPVKGVEQWQTSIGPA